MYPYIKLIRTLFRAKNSPQMNLDEKSVLNCRAGLTDIDVFVELNNARHLTYMEFGRWDFAQRTGLLSIMRKNKWAFAVGGASVCYRRRIK